MFELNYKSLNKRTKQELVNYIMEGNKEYISGSGSAFKAIRDIPIDYKQENFILVCLDNASNILKTKILFKGGISSSTVDIRLIFNEILKTDACTKIILAHNHPSGSLAPSIADREVTDKIRDAAEIFKIKVLDHIIFSRKEYLSFREEGMIHIEE